MEASGTSGMKAALNGVLNCSIMDGWWDEAYQSDVGWAIGRGEDYANPATADELESHALYDLLESNIVPLFYDRNRHDIPIKWVKMMKACISKLAPQFNTNRMVQEYTERLYLPALEKSRMLGADNIAGAVRQARDMAHLRANWDALRVDQVDADTAEPLGVRQTLNVFAIVHLGGLTPADVRVQLYSGRLDNESRLVNASFTDMKHEEDLSEGRHRYSGALLTTTSGRHGFAVRIVPGAESMEGLVVPGLIHWDTEAPPAAKPRVKAEKVA
jgi:starch phosphorylase